MEFRHIGSLEVSTVGLGCSNFGRAITEQSDATRIVEAAIDVGINHFDTADMYNYGRSEDFLGAALAGHRDEVVVATKVGQERKEDGTIVPNATPQYIRNAVEGSLRRLRTDHIDLYLLHIIDPSTPIAETLAVMTELVEEGKVREIGCSQVDLAFLRQAEAAAAANSVRPFVNVQNLYNLLDHERDDTQLGVKEECARAGLAFVPFAPLASGMLSGKYRRGEEPPEGSRLTGRPITGYSAEALLTERVFDVVERLRDFAESRGHAILELAIAGLLARPQFASIIAGATSPEQVRANAKGSEWTLTPEEFEEVKQLTHAPD